MKLFLRIIRVIFGIALLVAFVYGLYVFGSAAPTAKDLVPADGNVDGLPPVAQKTPAPAGEGDAVSAPVVPAGETGVPVVEQVPEPTPLPDSPAGRAAALGLPEPPDIDINSWEFLLVNGDHSIDKYVPEQFGFLNQTISETDIQTSYSVNRGYDSAVDIRIAQALLDMCVAAKQEGLSVYLTSCYRSYDSQADNFRRVCANNGISDGKDANGHYITMPAGCSEHQSGLCADIVDQWYGTLRSSEQRNKPLQVWLAAHCQDYGFILRFPEGKEDITGVMYESWHFRYVGQTAAKYIMENGLCLEEFLDLYR